MIAAIPNRTPGSLLLLTVLTWLLGGCGGGDTRTQGRGAGAETTVEAVVIRPQLIEDKVQTTGTLLANEEVELRPEISGRVVGVYFEEGARVRKGEVLLKINDRELQAELKRKKLEETLAAEEENRRRALYEISGISREEYDRVVNALRMVQAEREVIESQLAETEIIAPLDGTIGLRYVSEGSFVSPNSLVASIQNIDTVKAEFSVPEKYAGRIAKGVEVMVSVGEAEGAFRGVIYAVEAKVDPATRTLKARATIPNPGARLIPGSFARVAITLERITDAVVIPTDAILPEMTGQTVFTCANGLARSVPITTGIRTERSVQVTEGLNPGDTLIVTGLLQIGDGKAVRITHLQDE